MKKSVEQEIGTDVKQMRRGSAMMEAIMAISTILVLAAVAFYIYQKQKVPNEVRGWSSKINTVIVGTDNAKNEYNNGRYIASSKKAIRDIRTLELALGGTKATENLTGWYYECADGDSSEVKITTPDILNADVRDGIVLQINSQDPTFTAAVNGNVIEVTRDKVVCK